MAFHINENCIGCTACVSACPVGAISGVKKEQHFIDSKLCIECGACGRVCPAEAVTDTAGNLIFRLKKSLWSKPVIDIAKCYACENCVAACPADALGMKSESLPLTSNYAVLISPKKCVSCGWCADNCQFDALHMEVMNANN